MKQLPSFEEILEISTPRVHPNGFIQVDLDPQDRAHFWHPALGVRQKSYSPIHDHNFSFQSFVCRGRIFNAEYDLEQPRNNDDEPSHAIWHCVPEGPHNSTLMMAEDELPGILHNAHSEVVLAGEDYPVAHAQFHEVMITVPTITVMRKTRIFPGHNARVLVPIGQAPDNDYRRDEIDMARIHEIMKECYG